MADTVRRGTPKPLVGLGGKVEEIIVKMVERMSPIFRVCKCSIHVPRTIRWNPEVFEFLGLRGRF